MEECNYGYCNFCESKLIYKSTGSIEHDEEWLECEECGQLYEMDGSLIIED